MSLHRESPCEHDRRRITKARGQQRDRLALMMCERVSVVLRGNVLRVATIRKSAVAFSPGGTNIIY